MIIRRFSTALIFSFALLIPSYLFSQSGGIKFGKIDKQYLEMETYEKDTSADAVVLADYGKSYFRYHKTKGHFQLYFNRHRRIKILTSNGYDWADHQIPIYHDGTDKEVVTGLKGYTYNLVKGKIEKHKLEKNSVFDEEFTEHWDIKKFTMPNVTEGSVIEFTYTVVSDFIFNLREWKFQESIPTVWSEYQTSIPEYLNYKKLQQGYIPLALTENTTEAGSITFSGTDSNGRMSSDQINYINNVERWAAKDVPAMVSEKYMTTVNDYISKIEFELAVTKFPNSPVRSIMDTWETMNTKLLQMSIFGDQLNRKGFIKDQAAAIVAEYPDPASRIQAAVAHIKSKMNWDGYYHRYSNGNIKKAYEEGKGNSADINLTLIALLRGMGMEANPVILSTRSHGRVNPFYPILNKFNHVIAHVVVDDKYYLLDATDKLQPVNSLPFECLNGKGRLISESGSGWVDLRSHENSSNFTKVDVRLNDDDEYIANVQSSCTGYEAYSVRKKIIKSGRESYIKDKVTAEDGFSPEDFSISNLESPGKPIVEEYEVSPGEHILDAGNLIYIDPLLVFGEDKNPMKMEKRAYPVDFGYPMASSYRFTIPIPEGYSVEEIPKPALVSLPNKGGVFRYNIINDGKNLTLVTSYQIKQTLFLPEEYGIIKQFFDILVAKHAEKIVLKKNT